MHRICGNPNSYEALESLILLPPVIDTEITTINSSFLALCTFWHIDFFYNMHNSQPSSDPYQLVFYLS